MNRKLGVGLTLAATVAFGADANHAPQTDPSANLDLIGDYSYSQPLDPDQAQQALATGMSCDVHTVKGVYNFPAAGAEAAGPNTDIELDTSLHLTPQATAAFNQYYHDDRVIWRTYDGLEVFEHDTADKARLTLKDLGSSALQQRISIESPDVSVLVATEALKPGRFLVPYEMVAFSTRQKTVITKVPCNKAVVVGSESHQANDLGLVDLPLPPRIDSYPAHPRGTTMRYTYGDKLFTK